MNRTGIDKRIIFAGSQQKKSDNFVANEVRSKIYVDRSTITRNYIRRNKIDVTINDEIMRVKDLLEKLRLCNK